MDETFPDYYELLRVSRNATQEQIKSAYRQAIKFWFPDNFRDRPDAYQREAHEMTVLLNKAYEILASQVKRSEYDDILADWELGDLEFEDQESHEDAGVRGNNTLNLAQTLVQAGFEVIDKRPQGGALWVVCDQERGKSLAALVNGVKFIFAPNGGRATRKRPAWYYEGF